MSGTLVIIKADNCGHCRNLTEKLPKITKAIREFDSQLNIEIVALPSMSSKIDTSKYPAGLSEYAIRFPMILLVPAATWKKATKKLSDNVEIRKGVQVMNMVWENGKLESKYGYDFRESEGFIKWLQDSYKNEDYKKYSKAGETVGADTGATAEKVETKPSPKSPPKASPVVTAKPVAKSAVKPTTQVVKMVTVDKNVVKHIPAGPKECKINIVGKK